MTNTSIQFNSVEDITNAKTSDLVEWYNANVDGPQIKKFSDRATAERRVTMLWEAINTLPAKPTRGRKGQKPKTKKTRAKGKAPKAVPSAADRAAAIAASWQDPKVAAKRKQRSAVKVTGNGVNQEFRSVSAAFKELDLPVSKEIRFRMHLKEAGTLKEFGYNWKIIPLNY